MKRIEKNELSKQKVINAAIVEFGTNSYHTASLNTICNCHNVSKGLIYHYFENKEELYLCCVEICFKHLVNYLEEPEYNFCDFHHCISQYLQKREDFFDSYPYYKYIFFSSILTPPTQLENRIREIKKEFDRQTVDFYKSILEHVVLRDSVTQEDAIDYFMVFQEMFNGYYQRNVKNTSDFNSMVKSHELQLSKILNMMLFGIVKEDIQI